MAKKWQMKNKNIETIKLKKMHKVYLVYPKLLQFKKEIQKNKHMKFYGSMLSSKPTYAATW